MPKTCAGLSLACREELIAAGLRLGTNVLLAELTEMLREADVPAALDSGRERFRLVGDTERPPRASPSPDTDRDPEPPSAA